MAKKAEIELRVAKNWNYGKNMETGITRSVSTMTKYRNTFPWDNDTSLFVHLQ